MLGTVDDAPPTTTGPAPATAAGQPRPTTTARPAAPRAPRRRRSPPPAPVPLVVRPALPGEGQWQATGLIVQWHRRHVRPGMWSHQAGPTVGLSATIFSITSMR
ncbi:MAG: hypothetical protein ACLQVK_16040 [Acidimicrobiales bacterium]